MKFCQVRENIREERLSYGFTQEDVAFKLGIDRKTYNRYEQGIVKIPIEVIVALAKLYRVTIDYLLGVPNYAYTVSAKEIRLLNSYRKKVDLQRAIDLILDI